MGSLRIIGGTARGRRLKAPGGGVRPATARARKGLFDYLAQFLPGSRVLDLYCGSGGLGLEALSRGALEVWFVDKAARSLTVAEDNAAVLGFSELCRFARRDVFAFLGGFADYDTVPFDLVFAAPPYRIAEPGRILEALAASGTLAPGGSVCLEFSRHNPEPAGDRFTLDRRKVYGETVIDVWDFAGETQVDGEPGGGDA